MDFAPSPSSTRVRSVLPRKIEIRKSSSIYDYGQFNDRNPQWGSDKVTEKGKIVEYVLSNLNLCILNDGSNTYLHLGNGSYSSIDLTIVDPS